MLLAVTVVVLALVLLREGLELRLSNRHGAVSKIRFTATTLEQAINQFYNEYERLPDPRASPAATDATFDTASAEGVGLLTILLGKETGPDVQNIKQMAFLTLPNGNYSENKVDGLVDPFGHGYRVVIDYDGNEQLAAPGDSGATGILNGRHAVVYSLGKSGKGGADAIRNW